MALEQWLPKSRRGGGEFDTNNFTVPTGIDEVYVVLDVTLSEFTTPDLSVTATIEASTDGGQTWIFQGSVNWIGATLLPRPGVPPLWAFSLNDLGRYTGSLLRVHFSTLGTFRWGLLGELR